MLSTAASLNELCQQLVRVTPHRAPHASRMDFELLHDATKDALKPLRDRFESIVLAHPLLVVLALGIVPVTLLILSHRLDRDLERANATIGRKSK